MKKDVSWDKSKDSILKNSLKSQKNVLLEIAIGLVPTLKRKRAERSTHSRRKAFGIHTFAKQLLHPPSKDAT